MNPKPEYYTLAKDIEDKVLHPSTAPEIKPEPLAELGVSMAQKVVAALNRETRGKRTDKTIYASEVGKPCLRQTWYNYHKPELAETLLPKNILKFLYGDLLEDILLFLAKVAGHEVTHMQERIEIPLRDGWKITGRMDAVIDGVVVDVKSTSPYGFRDMMFDPDGFDDKFGYKAQVSVYRHALAERDSIARDGSLFLVDKQNGSLGLVPVSYQPLFTPDAITEESKVDRLLAALEHGAPPPRFYSDVPDGGSGNRKLGVACSYCPFKRECWPGLRGFAYSNGPRFLTVVKKEPNVPELDLTKEQGEE